MSKLGLHRVSLTLPNMKVTVRTQPRALHKAISRNYIALSEGQKNYKSFKIKFKVLLSVGSIATIIILYEFASDFINTDTLNYGQNTKLVCKCDTAEDGTLEVIQLKQYLVKKSEKFFEKFNVPSSPSSHSFLIQNTTMTDCCVRFVISEKPLKYDFALVGGSSFLITAISDRYLVTCSIIDHFNGQYTVYCPLHDFCVNVTAEASYINFGAFYEQKYTGSLIFWTKRLCLIDALNETSVNYRLPNNYRGWYRSNTSDSWSWVKIINRSVRRVTKDELRDCLSSVKSPVYFTGDSHLRYIFYALMNLYNDLPPEMARKKTRHVVTYKNFQYVYSAHLTYYFEKYGNKFTPFFPGARQLLLKLMSNYTTENQTTYSNVTKHQIFFFSVGAFDIETDNIENLQDSIIPQLTDFIITLQELAQVHDGRVIFLTSPPRLRQFDKRAEGRNNARIAAYNKLVIDVLKPHGITIVNFFAMTVNRYKEETDGHHFLPTLNSAGENVAIQSLYELCRYGNNM